MAKKNMAPKRTSKKVPLSESEADTDKESEIYESDIEESEIESVVDGDINSEINDDEIETITTTDEDERYQESDVDSEIEFKEGPELDDCFYDYEELNENDKKNVMVPKEERITTKKITKYELVRILGTRAKQISLGAQVMVKGIENQEPLDIALLELKHKMIPYIIKRNLPDGSYELWKVSELELE